MGFWKGRRSSRRGRRPDQTGYSAPNSAVRVHWFQGTRVETAALSISPPDDSNSLILADDSAKSKDSTDFRQSKSSYRTTASCRRRERERTSDRRADDIDSLRQTSSSKSDHKRRRCWAGTTDDLSLLLSYMSWITHATTIINYKRLLSVTCSMCHCCGILGTQYSCTSSLYPKS